MELSNWLKFIFPKSRSMAEKIIIFSLFWIFWKTRYIKIYWFFQHFSTLSVRWFKIIKNEFCETDWPWHSENREEFLNRQMEGLELLFDFWGIFYDPIVFKFKLIHFSVKHLLTDRPERTSELRKISNC